MRCKGLFRVGWMVLLGAVSGIPLWVDVDALADVGQPPVSFEDVSQLINFPVRSFTVGGNAQVGAAWFDYDKDGWLDLYLTNGCNQENGLFHNNGNGTFSNVAAEAGVTNGLGSNGVIAADIDNDGFQDLFVTGEGGYQGGCARPVVLYHNNGDGTFDDITASSGIVGPSTQFSAAMADINNDGFLDLFITGSGRQNGNGPPNKLFLNNGDLTFLDISASSGVDTDRGACAAFFTDVNDDGFIDLHVANCVPFFPPERNELFINNGDLTFTEVGVEAGLGATGYWMGFGPGDFDNDGDIDIFVTNLGAGFVAFNRLHRNNGDGSYTNVSFAAGAAVSEFGWGATMTDFDNDGFADIFFAGACPAFVIGAGFGNPGTMLFNRGDGTFANHTQDMPTNLSSRSTSGVAAGDYDNDGFVDIVIAADAFGADPGGPTIFHNLGNDNGWVTIKLQGTTSNRDAVGARVSVSAGGMTQTKEIYAGSSFLSMDSQWLVFGLGAHSGTEQIIVRWPSGLFETFPNVLTGETVTLVEGPMITCPDSVTLTSGDSTDPAATGMPTANDNCDDDVDIAFTDNVGFPDCLADPMHFVIERTWTTIDDCGNSSECVQIITVMRQQVSLIIKQGACPSPVNAHSNGVVPMLLVGEPGFDVTAVLTPSLRVSRCECGGGDGSVPPIDGPPGPKIQVLDLNHPFGDEVTCAGPCACHADQSRDDIDDLSMKFPTDDMVSTLPLSLGEGLVILSVTGELDAVAYPAGPINVGFVASDCIVIVPPGDLAPANALVGSNVTDTWVVVTPIDLNVDGGGFADFARSYYSGTAVTLTAPLRSDGRRFVRWSVDGVLQEVGVRTLDLVVDQDIKLRAVYERPRRPRPDQPREGDGDLD